MKRPVGRTHSSSSLPYMTIFLCNDHRELKGVGIVANVGLWPGTMLIKNYFLTNPPA
jgi:hypothetical protein